MAKTEKPIRVAHIMGKMMAGGVESMVMNYYRHIDRSRVQFDFIIDEDSAVVPYAEIGRLGGKVYPIPPYQKPAAYHRALVRLLRQNAYPIVHSHVNALSVFSLFAAKRAGVPVRIAHSHSTAGKGETARNLMKYALRPFSKVFPTHHCACSDYAGRWLFGNTAVDSGRVMLVKNAVDISKFAFDPELRERVRAELGLADRFVIGHVGRFVKQKNHAFLLDIFSQICAQRPDAMLLLVGEGELRQEIRDKVKRLGLDGHVRFLGVRDDVHRLFMGMDVFLLPSLYEGLPVVLVEAQVNGLAIVASDSVTREAKLTDQFTYVSLAGTAREWADAVNHTVAVRTSDAKRFVEAGYEIQAAADALCEYYAQIVL